MLSCQACCQGVRASTLFGTLDTSATITGFERRVLYPCVAGGAVRGQVHVCQGLKTAVKVTLVVEPEQAAHASVYLC